MWSHSGGRRAAGASPCVSPLPSAPRRRWLTRPAWTRSRVTWILPGLSKRSPPPGRPQPAGFWTSNDPTNPRPHAWCTACETKVQSTGGDWTDESEAFAGISLLCGTCYDEVRRFNHHPRPDRGATTMSSRMRLTLSALGAMAALGFAWLVHPYASRSPQPRSSAPPSGSRSRSAPIASSTGPSFNGARASGISASPGSPDDCSSEATGSLGPTWGKPQ